MNVNAFILFEVLACLPVPIFFRAIRLSYRHKVLDRQLTRVLSKMAMLL